VGDVEIADHFASLVTKIRELFDLGPDWDSYGARRVQRDAVRAALGLLAHANQDVPLPTVSPVASGGLQFEWGGDDDAVEIEVGPMGQITVLIDINGEVRERNAAGPGDPLIAEALTWAAKVG